MIDFNLAILKVLFCEFREVSFLHVFSRDLIYYQDESPIKTFWNDVEINLKSRFF